METIKLEKSGNFMWVTDLKTNITTRFPAKDTYYDFEDKNRVLVLTWDKNNGETYHRYKVSQLVDLDEEPWDTFITLDTFLSENLGFNTGGGTPGTTPNFQQVTDGVGNNITTNDVVVSDGENTETTIQKDRVFIADPSGSNTDIQIRSASFMDVDGTNLAVATLAAIFGTQEVGMFLTTQQPGKQANISVKLATEFFTDLEFLTRNLNFLIPFKPDGTYTVAMREDIQNLDISSNYANDTLAQAGGIPIGGLYHTSGVVKIRLT